MSKARELAALGNAYSDGALSNRNLIINGAMQVAQRGTSATYSSNTSRGFVCDRWFGEGYPLNMTITQSNIAYDGISYKSSSLSSITGAWTFFQAIEDGYVYNAGKTLTFSFVASGSGTIQPITWIATANQQNFGSAITLTGTPTRYEITHTITGSGTGDDLFIGLSGSGGSLNISLVQLEVGDTATPFEHRSYGQELALCQRYYEKWGTSNNNMLYIGGGIGMAWAPNEVRIQLQYSEKRTSPTCSASGTLTWGDGAGSGTLTSFNFDQPRARSVLLYGTLASGGLTGGKAAQAYWGGSGSFNVTFDAEL